MTTSTNKMKRQTIIMDQTVCSIKGVTDNLRVQIQILTADIKACEKSKAEFDRHLTILETRRDELKARIKGNLIKLSYYINKQ